MKRNRIIAMCLALTLLFGCFAACGNTEQEPVPESSQTEAEQSAPVEDKAPEPEPAEAMEEGSTEEAEETSVLEEPGEPEAQSGVPDLSAKAGEIVSYTEEGYSLPLFEDTLEISYAPSQWPFRHRCFGRQTLLQNISV